MERIDDEGWTRVDAGNVCQNCFDDVALKAVVRENVSDIGCDHCGDDRARFRRSCDINLVIEHIFSRIDDYFQSADVLPYDASEGGYLFGNTWDTYDLIGTLVKTENTSVLTAIRDSGENRTWCGRDPFSDRISEESIGNWLNFCDKVKHVRRFLLKPGELAILSTILGILRRHRLFLKIKPGTSFFRARTYKSSKRFRLTLENVSIPPLDILAQSANRMSAAGIPSLYCSTHPATCIAESKFSMNPRDKHDSCSLAEFENLVSFRILNLCDLPRVPSIFGNMALADREALIFVTNFRDDIVKSVVRDGREHVEYTPSQVFSEYIRHFAKVNGESLDGIVYPSAQDPSGRNYVLFLDHEEIVKGPGTSKAKLQLTHAKYLDGKLAD